MSKQICLSSNQTKNYQHNRLQITFNILQLAATADRLLSSSRMHWERFRLVSLSSFWLEKVVMNSIGNNSSALINLSEVRFLNSEMASMPWEEIDSANAIPRLSSRLSFARWRKKLSVTYSPSSSNVLRLSFRASTRKASDTRHKCVASSRFKYSRWVQTRPIVTWNLNVYSI